MHARARTYVCMCMPVTLCDVRAPAGKSHQNEYSLDDNVECEDSERPVRLVGERLGPVLADDATVDEHTAKEYSLNIAVDDVHDGCTTYLEQRILLRDVETFAAKM